MAPKESLLGDFFAGTVKVQERGLPPNFHHNSFFPRKKRQFVSLLTLLRVWLGIVLSTCRPGRGFTPEVPPPPGRKQSQALTRKHGGIFWPTGRTVELKHATGLVRSQFRREGSLPLSLLGLNLHSREPFLPPFSTKDLSFSSPPLLLFLPFAYILLPLRTAKTQFAGKTWVQNLPKIITSYLL